MKGICFKEDLYEKTVFGYKTQTRRIALNLINYHLIEISKCDNKFKLTFQNDALSDIIKVVKPRYNIGEKVYLKEPYRLYKDDIIKNSKNLIKDWLYCEYKYLNNNIKEINIKWKNKLFMPANIARKFIEIIDINVQKIKEINIDDCFKELGLIPELYNNNKENILSEFRKKWESINGKGSWDLNPYVFIYDYKITEI